MQYYYSQFTPKIRLKSPLFQQLYMYIKQGIVSQKLPHSSRIPPTRTLAVTWGISRNTVITALDMLKSEGLITSIVGGGVFVHYPITPVKNPPSSLSQWANMVKSRSRHHTGICSLGVTDTDSFPTTALKKSFASKAYSAIHHSNRKGNTNFIDAICAYVLNIHGINANAHTVIPIASTQAGLDIIFKTLFDKHQHILLDCPCYTDIISLLKSVGIGITPRVLSDCNMAYDTAPQANATYITPAHQYPVGCTMAHADRISLVQWAIKNHAWIIEDSTDWVHTPTSPTSVYSMCPEQTVFIGSFSKILAPSIKVAYIIAPQNIAHKIRTTAHICGHETSTFMQVTIADMLQSGALYRHINRTQKIYKHRLQYIKNIVPDILPMATVPHFVQGGLQTPILLPHDIPDTTIAQHLYTDGYGIKALSTYCHTTPHINGLHMGFGNADTDIITQSLQHIAKLIYT